MSRYVIVDVANLFQRARHAAKGDAFTKAGFALHITFMSLRKLYQEYQADHIVLVAEGGSWRYKAYPEYKAKRRLEKEMAHPRDREEAEVINETMDSFINFMAEKTHVTVLRCDGIEGDDFIARWVQLHPQQEHIILSGDSDFVQLLAPNVSIYDGMMERFVRHDGVFDLKGRPLVFGVKPGNGKIEVKGTFDEVRKQHLKEQKEYKRLHPDHEITEFEHQIDSDWYRRALFIKCVRGDATDGIFSAYPGVRYAGTRNKVGIEQAWEDREQRGFHWNNFMLQRWEKLVGSDSDGNKIVEEVSVKDEYARNEMLIDLTKQPDHVKETMDRAIIAAVSKEPVKQIGIHFMRFCGEHQLPALSQDAPSHAAYLKLPYAA